MFETCWFLLRVRLMSAILAFSFATRSGANASISGMSSDKLGRIFAFTETLKAASVRISTSSRLWSSLSLSCLNSGCFDSFSVERACGALANRSRSIAIHHACRSTATFAV